MCFLGLGFSMHQSIVQMHFFSVFFNMNAVLWMLNCAKQQHTSIWWRHSKIPDGEWSRRILADNEQFMSENDSWIYNYSDVMLNSNPGYSHQRYTMLRRSYYRMTHSCSKHWKLAHVITQKQVTRWSLSGLECPMSIFAFCGNVAVS